MLTEVRLTKVMLTEVRLTKVWLNEVRLTDISSPTWTLPPKVEQEGVKYTKLTLNLNQ